MSDFLQRLKQRKLVQWAIAYVAFAFALIQVIDVVSDSYGWSHAVMHLVFGALVVGFVVTLVLAWYHGEQGRQRASGTELLLIALVLAVGGGLLWHFARIAPTGTYVVAGTAKPEAYVASTAPASTSNAAPTPTATSIPAKSIAVLPFENLSSDKDNAYFSDGMQDLILTKLADIGDLKVISRTSTEKYKSHPDDLKSIAQQLGVATILEGSVQKAGKQVLINVQLIDASTDSHIWAQSYQRTLDNIFGVEGEVAEKIATALNAKLTPAESARVAKVPTTNAAAYNAFLQGNYYEDHIFVPNNDKTAADYYRKAVAQDPHFVLAWARLTQVLSRIARYSGSDADAAQAKSALDHVLALSPDSLDMRMAQGWYLDYVKKDLDGALQAFDAVARAQPNNAQALFGIGVMHAHNGQWQDALGFLKKAASLAPEDKAVLDELAVAFEALRRYPEAELTARRMIAIDPNDGEGWSRLAEVYTLTGDPAGALAAYEEAPSGIRANPYLTFNRVQAEVLQRDYAAARKLLDGLKSAEGLPMRVIEMARGDVEQAVGDTALAREHYLRAEALLEAKYKQDPTSDSLWDLGMLSAELGRHKQALARVALANREGAAEKQFDPFRMACADKYEIAQIQVVLGNAGEAIGALDWLLARPAGHFVSVPLLRVDPMWDPIRHDPRFQALLKKYASAKPAAASSGATP